MYVKLKNNKQYLITALREERLSTTDKQVVWILRFVISERVTSDEIDKELTLENIAELTVLNDEVSVTFTGYDKIANVTIVFDNENLTSRCAVQLQKKVMTETEETE